MPNRRTTGVVLLPAQRLDVRVEVEGIVEEVLVREGEWVEAGQPVARLSTRIYERNLAATEAQVAERQAKLALAHAGKKSEEIAAARQAVATARTQFEWSVARAERFTKAYREKGVNEQTFEDAVRQKEVDEERLRQAELNLAVVRSGTRAEHI